MENYRIIIVIVIMALSLTDLVMTSIYVSRYKQWQPNKPYKLIELNPVLVFLWNNLGFVIGMIIGSIVLLTLNFLIAKNVYWLIPVIIGIVLIFNIFNHFRNLDLLHKLIIQYPTGYLPVETFGKIEGGN